MQLFRLEGNNFDSEFSDSEGFREFFCVLSFEIWFYEDCFDVFYDDA